MKARVILYSNIVQRIITPILLQESRTILNLRTLPLCNEPTIAKMDPTYFSWSHINLTRHSLVDNATLHYKLSFVDIIVVHLTTCW